MNKIRQIIISITILLLLSGCYKYNYCEVIKENWHIIMPSSSKEIYAIQGLSSFNGDGVRYHVFSYENNEEVKDWLNFTNKQQKTYFANNFQEAIEDFLSQINKKIEIPVNYNNCLYYYDYQNDYSEIIIALNQEEKIIYVIESFF